VVTARAAVQTGLRSIQLWELPVPDGVGVDEGLLQVEGCGLCGSDYEQYVGAFAGIDRPLEFPLIPGHEFVGRVARVGEQAAALWGIEVGDRVAVEPAAGNEFAYSAASVSRSPGLWGGYADYVWLHPASVLHKLPEHLSVEDAVLFNPLGAGFAWTGAARVQRGQTVLIEGPGQRGLACVIAAAEAGADQIIVTGLKADAHKLKLAQELGATGVVVADEVPVVDAVREMTRGRGVHCTIDVSPFATAPVIDAIELTERGGTIVLAGLKGMKVVPNFISDHLVLKSLSMVGVLGVDTESFKSAINVIASGRYPLEKLHTHTVAIEQVERAIRILGGEIEGEEGLHITVVPKLEARGTRMIG
jgi:threonine dehydrogenase-like Zn-dependent dehydrogenase